MAWALILKSVYLGINFPLAKGLGNNQKSAAQQKKTVVQIEQQR